MDERASTPPGDGPYRTPPPRFRVRTRRGWIVAAALTGAAALAAWLSLGTDDAARPSLHALPTDLFGDARAWPLPLADLPPATPLAPLLVSDQPATLAVLTPGEGAISLRRGHGITFTFNRPMVEGSQVGRPLEALPLALEPAVAGQAMWVSRSRLSFTPSAEAFGAEVREVRLSLVPGLTSLGGELLVDEAERTLVLDGAPRVDPSRSRGRVSAGAPLPLFFDAPVRGASLAQELMAYEIGGGARTLPVRLVPSRTQPEHGFRLDVLLARALEPGAQIGIALAPRYQPWGGSAPAVLEYELAPRPQLEGIDCPEGAAFASQCTFTASPGAIIDIGPTLRLLASARLEDFAPGRVSITPPLSALAVRLAPHGPPQRRLIEISGEWEPDQVYEVRVGGLRTESGEPVRALPPLAVRSAGHAPELRVASGVRVFEADQATTIPFAAIHVDDADVVYRAVAPGEELRALVSPTPFVRSGGVSIPLAPLAPTARPNRWGPGELAWRGEERESGMAVVGFRADAARASSGFVTSLVQATDLGVTVRAHGEGLLVWVTRLSNGRPVSGATVDVADTRAVAVATGRTDRHGVARIALEASPLVVGHALRVQLGDERVAMLLDPRTAIGPAAMGLSPGQAPVASGTVATLFTDRGAYRPGERVRAKLLLRAIDGDRATAVTSGRFLVRLFAPSTSAPFAEHEVQPSAFGTAAVEMDLPGVATLGDWLLEVSPSGEGTTALGNVSLRVAEFRQPTFRVDLEALPSPLRAGDRVSTGALATYLFGAPVTRGRARWSVTRAGAAPMPERWSGYRFSPIGAAAGHGTVASGDEALDARGHVALEAPVELAASARTTMHVEVEVTDGAGHTQASERSFVAYPSEVEVGLREGDDWQELGSELSLETIAIANTGEPVAGHPLSARIVREGWHGWWEWQDGGGEEEEADGAYRLRRDRATEEVHRCALTSGTEPVRCTHRPARPGTYLLEITATDVAGRVSTASRRVYVAGPDEHPDRDPPGAPVEVTAARAQWTVGETAELAFESPWDGARALITVEREGVLHVEHRQVGAGGQTLRIPVTAAMVPNVFVGVTLVRPRVGPPAEGVDLMGPDLRFGIAELRVAPAAARLEVALEVSARARPGDTVPVTVTVRDARGRPVRGEVALWAVDEGTLRLTGYQVPDPSRGLFRPRPPAFAWEDIRRALVSRLEVPPMPRAGGDGGDSAGERSQVDDRERFEPTPLWAPLLVTDAEGRATTTMTLPDRPTEYRVMAVAVDRTARVGRASSALIAEQPIVLRPALPAFAITGDRFEAAVFVHNATDAPMTIEVRAIVGEEAGAYEELQIQARGEVRFAREIRAPRVASLALRFEARSGEERVAVADEIHVLPRGRLVRSQLMVAGDGQRELTVGLPAGTPTHVGSARLTVASHPFIGLDAAVEGIEAYDWGGTESRAAMVLAMAAQAGLEVRNRAHGASRDEASARGRRAVERLLDLQSAGGAFGRWGLSSASYPEETALAVHALVAARERGWIAATDPRLVRAREYLVMLASGSAFGDYYGEEGLERNAHALRVLAALEAGDAARANALYEQRERLSPYGLAQLALALGEDDARVETLVLEACTTVLADRTAEAESSAVIRWNDHSARTLGAVLEAATRYEVGRPYVDRLARALLAQRMGGHGLPWGSPLETARALSALEAYARLWQWDELAQPHATLDGRRLTPAARSRSGATYHVPIHRLVGEHRLVIEGADEGPVFAAIDGAWTVPLGELDGVARGRRVALHRVYETAEGLPIAEGATVPLGAMIRVRLFVHTEDSAPPRVALYDPLPAGFEAVDASHETSPRASLGALLGTSPDDEAYDARAHHAMRALGSISHRAFHESGSAFYFDQLPSGLAEYTYAIRATTRGTFTAPPAQLEALHDRAFVARSSTARLRVGGTER